MAASGGIWSSVWLSARSLLWTILLPGVISGYLPWRYFGLRDGRLDLSSPVRVLGLLCIVAGVTLLGACIVEFARRGRGTLSPADPPRHLVIQGLYRYVRNPMYLAVATILWGEWLLVPSVALALYWLVFFAAVNLFVMGYEEPYLRQRFGDSYERYTRRVGRWIPTLRNMRSGGSEKQETRSLGE
jgi:protein-S-isoprenylcysteine O-methyltransferase Ste14